LSARRRTRVAAYALCRDPDDRVLLCRIVERIAPGGVWTLPGGGLDFGEPPARAALRELTEETGLTGTILQLLDVTDRVVDQPRGVRMHAIQIVYRVRVDGGELRDETDGTTDTCAWFTVADALDLRLGQMARRIIENDEAGRLGAAAMSRDAR
jgi:ADP-ribose pyrophosphatase YjhB (NUDIX family)